MDFLPSAAANRRQNMTALIVPCYHKGKKYIDPLIFFRKVAKNTDIYRERYTRTHKNFTVQARSIQIRCVTNSFSQQALKTRGS